MGIYGPYRTIGHRSNLWVERYIGYIPLVSYLNWLDTNTRAFSLSLFLFFVVVARHAMSPIPILKILLPCLGHTVIFYIFSSPLRLVLGDRKYFMVYYIYCMRQFMFPRLLPNRIMRLAIYIDYIRPSKHWNTPVVIVIVCTIDGINCRMMVLNPFPLNGDLTTIRFILVNLSLHLRGRFKCKSTTPLFIHLLTHSLTHTQRSSEYFFRFGS